MISKLGSGEALGASQPNQRDGGPVIDVKMRNSEEWTGQYIEDAVDRKAPGCISRVI